MEMIFYRIIDGIPEMNACFKCQLKGWVSIFRSIQQGLFLEIWKVFFEYVQYVEPILERYLVKLNVADQQLYVVYTQYTRFTFSSF